MAGPRRRLGRLGRRLARQATGGNALLLGVARTSGATRMGSSSGGAGWTRLHALRLAPLPFPPRRCHP